ncbi:baseplate J/gp47 family protein [Brevibacillus laterosporus]|uniref:Baseplate J/gp47 family protein n=1 Tax=Brevibacillus laterosporus TaxID=1465 RepID=A0AAP3DKR1_BRELA|nr:baseplate J/gp47 family protein [Brevibacillus laterosporus]MCR8981655.1 baseplate J/gp47 family protein [Brevibacillus laterosporus]MCZ0808810.1 baseplate J/gp47 family protein [Brevibacillus laterosporus]MCZ0827217.1 baseplate J/gp47 family protein [Brevibacillus laterosporus]MCZ0850973.1 baseplate J/gp47 family protein [Brevibacillus laterosporus]
MAYFAPYIDETGYHMPFYADIRDELVNQAKQIFGQDMYLGNDSQDYQFISVFANMLYDSYLICQAVYNSRGPATATGAGLDVVVGVNGIKRLKDTYSKTPVILTGTPGTIISNGIVSGKGYNWSLPSSVAIGADGTYSTDATCQTSGPIQVEANSITGIVTPTLGWTGVTNPEPAIAGRYTETDPQLRSRQAISTANPSRTVLEGIKGAIAAVSGVTRYEVYENDTGETNELGHPEHSITVVVEGGEDRDIAQAIFNRKTPGCYTNGTTAVMIQDIYDDDPTPIRFYRPAYVDIAVVVQVKRLNGFTTQTADDIASYIADFINSVALGNSSLVLSSLWGAALQANRVLTSPSFSITSLMAARLGEQQTTADILLLFYEAVRGSKANVTVNVVA